MKSLMISLVASFAALVPFTASAVSNGVEEKDADFPATAKLYVLGTHMCTGTFVNDTTVLTARHCIDFDQESGNVRVDSAGKEVASLNAFYITDGFDRALPAQLGYATDMAVVVFPAGTGAGRGITSYPVLMKRAPFPSDWVYILGYGGTDMTGANAGTLRSGQHQVMFVDDTSFSWVSFPGDQNVAPGDSGSAGYIDGQIAGLATLAGDVFGMAQMGAYRSLLDDKAQGLFEQAIHCSKGQCAAEFRP